MHLPLGGGGGDGVVVSGGVGVGVVVSGGVGVGVVGFLVDKFPVDSACVL